MTLLTRNPAAAPIVRHVPAPTPAFGVSQQTVASWKGFNLTDKLVAPVGRPSPGYRESDFALMAEWGFTFVRLPVSYLCWTTPRNWRIIDESQVEHLAQAVEWGRQYGLHINLGFHRIPGFSVHKGVKEPFNLFEDAEALDAACYQWQMLSERFADCNADLLSFNLFNEPGGVSTETYLRVVDAMTATIRAISPNRPIVGDGLGYGHEAVPELGERGIIHSGRGYMPQEISHYNAPFWNPGHVGDPDWPLTKNDGSHYGPAELEAFHNEWIRLSRAGQPVHIGEFGCYKNTPRKTMMAWMRDLLAIYDKHHFGWALWGIRGDFGVLDPTRTDVQFEQFRGHRLDREFLELLQSHLACQ